MCLFVSSFWLKLLFLLLCICFGPRGHIRHTRRAARNSSAALERQFRFYTVFAAENVEYVHVH